MNDTIFPEIEKVLGKGLHIDPASLYVAFEQVIDGRKKKGTQYPLAFLLTLLLLAKLAGETKISGAVQWTRERKEFLRQQLHWPKGFPTNSTYTYALSRCSGQQVAEAIAHVLIKARKTEEEERKSKDIFIAKNEENLVHTAMDGKTLRGTLKHKKEKHPPVHIMNWYECQSGIVLTQRSVKSKENEISAAEVMIHPTLVKGRIISADAMHTQKKWCDCVIKYGGQYISIVKKNQPEMYEDLQYFFNDPDAEKKEWKYAKTVNKAHGRFEIREMWTSTQMNEWFAHNWTSIAQVFKIRRWVQIGEKVREEMVYGITSLERQQANIERLMALVRAHWLIENHLHYRLDVTVGEDSCQVRTKKSPEVLTALNVGVLGLMDWLKVRNVAAQMRHFDAHAIEALHLLVGKLSR